jgi:hypothetical protein
MSHGLYFSHTHPGPSFSFSVVPHVRAATSVTLLFSHWDSGSSKVSLMFVSISPKLRAATTLSFSWRRDFAPSSLLPRWQPQQEAWWQAPPPFFITGHSARAARKILEGGSEVAW